MDVAPPWAKSGSTIWQLANQERRVAMVLLQKKQRHAVERRRYDRAVGLPQYLRRRGWGSEKMDGLLTVKFACHNELLFVLQEKETREEMMDVTTVLNA